MPRGVLTTRVVAFGVVVWLAAVGTGLAALWRYSETAGPEAAAPATWPNRSRLTPAADRPTLVMFAHPKCPCTRASIGELAILMAHAQNRVAAHVIFFRSTTQDASWENTDLRRSAAEIPGVQVSSDDDGAQAALFGADVSGQTFLYDAGGRLLFSGGITYARGPSGDNAGRAALTARLVDGQAAETRTPVFGCALRNAVPSPQ